MDTTEQLGTYTLRQRESLPRVGRDSLLLGDFATLHRGDRVCDLGCGVGVLSLCLARREEKLTLDGLDCQEDCVQLARENLSANRLTGRVFVDRVEALPPDLSPGSYDLVIANPPISSRAGERLPPVPGVLPGQGERMACSPGVGRRDGCCATGDGLPCVPDLRDWQRCWPG